MASRMISTRTTVTSAVRSKDSTTPAAWSAARPAMPVTWASTPSGAVVSRWSRRFSTAWVPLVEKGARRMLATISSALPSSERRKGPRSGSVATVWMPLMSSANVGERRSSASCPM